MKGTKLILLVMVLSLTLVCFFSAPALSVEDPWDVDGGHSDGGLGGNGEDMPPDTSLIVPEDPRPFHDANSGTWRIWLWLDVSYPVFKQWYFSGLLITTRVVAEATGGDKSAR